MSVASILGQDHKIDPLYLPDSVFAASTLSEVLSAGNTSGANDIILGVPGTSKQGVQNVDVLDAETVRTDTIKQVLDADPKVVRVEANLLLKEGVTAGEGVLEFELCNGTIATGAGKSLTLDTTELVMLNIGTPASAFGNVLGFDTATGRVQYQSAGGGGGGGIVASVVGGDNITVDNSSPANPIVNVNAALTGITSLTAAPGAVLTELKAGTGGDIGLVSANGTNKISVNNFGASINVGSVYFNSGNSNLYNVASIQANGGSDVRLQTNDDTKQILLIPGSSSSESYKFSKEKMVGPNSYDLTLQPQAGYVLNLNSGDGSTQITVSNTGVALGGALDLNTNAITDSAGVASSLELLGGELLLKDQQNTTLSTVPLPAPAATPTLAQVLTEGNTANADIDMDGNSLQAVGTVVGSSAADLVMEASGTRNVLIRDGAGYNRISVNNSGSVILQTNEVTNPTRISVSPNTVNLQAATVSCGSTDGTTDSLVEKVNAISSSVSTSLELQAQGTTQLTVSAAGVEIPTKLKVQESLSYTPTISSAIEVADTYNGTLAGLTVQNKNTGNNSSANVYLSGDNGSETTHYAALGRNNANYTAGGTNPTTMDGAAECTYLANVEGSVAVVADYFGNNTNSGIHLGYNSGAAAISVKADTGELSLGTTFTGGAYTYNPGTAGQALLSQGTGAPPVWGSVSAATPTLAQVLTAGNVANQNIDMSANDITGCANLGVDIVQNNPGDNLQLINDNGDLLGVGVNPGNLFAGAIDSTLRFSGTDTLSTSRFMINTNLQVVINNDDVVGPVSGVALDVRGSNDGVTYKGLRLPSMTAAQRTALSPSASGVIVYQTDATVGIYQWDGAAWAIVGGGGGGSQTLSQVLTTGNSAGNQDMVAVNRIGGNSTTGILSLGAASGAYAEIDNTLQEVTLSANKINLDFAGASNELLIDGLAGTAGQALLSQGAGVAPIWGAAQNTQAASLACTDAAGTTVYPIFTTSDAAGDKTGKVATGISYNDTTNTLLTTTFNGALVGNADTCTTADKSTNIVGGSAGSVPYQSAANITALIPIGTAGQVLTVAAGIPSWATPSTIASQIAVTAASGTSVVPLFCDNATPGNKSVIVDAGITYNPTTDTLNATTFNGALIGNADTATSATSASSAGTATNISSGVLGSIPYQSGPGATTFVGIGTAGQVLTVNSGVPNWETPSAGLGGNIFQNDATNSGSVATSGTSVGTATIRLGTNLVNALTATQTIALGNFAGSFIPTAPTLAPDNCVCIGNSAGYNAGSAAVEQMKDYVFIGKEAGYNIAFPQAGGVMVGTRAGKNARGFLNTFVGVEAGDAAQGDYTTAIGYKAGAALADCFDAVIIGPEAASDITNTVNYDGRFVVGNQYSKSNFLNGFIGNAAGDPKKLGFGTNDPQLVSSAVNCSHIEGDLYVSGIYQGMSGFRITGAVDTVPVIDDTTPVNILSTPASEFSFPYNQALLAANQRLRVTIEANGIGVNDNLAGYLQLVNTTTTNTTSGETQGSAAFVGFPHITLNATNYNTMRVTDTFDLADFTQGDIIEVQLLVVCNTGTHSLSAGSFVVSFELVRTG